MPDPDLVTPLLLQRKFHISHSLVAMFLRFTDALLVKWYHARRYYRESWVRFLDGAMNFCASQHVFTSPRARILMQLSGWPSGQRRQTQVTLARAFWSSCEGVGSNPTSDTILQVRSLQLLGNGIPGDCCQRSKSTFRLPGRRFPTKVFGYLGDGFLLSTSKFSAT